MGALLLLGAREKRDHPTDVIGFFKERSAFHVPVLLMLTLALKIPFITRPLPAENPTAGGLLDQWLYNRIWSTVSPVLLASIAVIILFLSALYANYLLTGRRMFQRQHLLVALSLVVFSSLFPGIQRLSPGMILLPVTILLYQQMMRLYHTSVPRTVVVNMGLITGTCILLYHPYWWMLPCCYFALATMRPFRLNEWLLLLFSCLVPAYLLLSFEYLAGDWNPTRHWPGWNPATTWPELNAWWVFAVAVGLLWWLVGFSNWQGGTRRMLIQSRKNWYVLLALGIFTLPTLLIPKGNFFEALTLLSFPFSAMASHAFVSEKRNLGALILFWIILLSAMATGWAVQTGRMP